MAEVKLVTTDVLQTVRDEAENWIIKATQFKPQGADNVNFPTPIGLVTALHAKVDGSQHYLSAAMNLGDQVSIIVRDFEADLAAAEAAYSQLQGAVQSLAFTVQNLFHSQNADPKPFVPISGPVPASGPANFPQPAPAVPAPEQPSAPTVVETHDIVSNMPEPLPEADNAEPLGDSAADAKPQVEA